MQVGDNKNFNSEINVTPFVDICLVLLVIFMVVTPMLQEGITVHLPYAKHTEKHEDDENHAIVVAVPNERQIFIQCAPWVASQIRPCHARALQGDNPTSPPVMLTVGRAN